MRILLLTQIVPFPPDSGPKVKTFHVLRYLAEHGHEVTLVSFVREHEKSYLEELKKYCAAIYPVEMRRSRVADARGYLDGLLSGLPFLVTRDVQAAMLQTVERLARESFDVVHADQLTMAQYALHLRRTNKRAMIVFDAHNAVYEIVERAKQTAMPVLRPVLALEAKRLKQYEGNLIRQFDHTLAVSEIDKQALLNATMSETRGGVIEDSRAAALASKISVIPIAVDCATLTPAKRVQASNNILTVSTLFYPPNADGVRWFLHEVLPHVKKQFLAATVSVVGPRPPQDLVDFGAQHSDYVTVTGYVPDLQPYFERAALMVVPVRAGSGMRVRILEALARGMPVVTTTTGVEGIDALNEEHLLVADEPTQFAEAVVRILKNPVLGEKLVVQGRRLAEEKYDWQVVLPKLEAVYASQSAK